MTVNKPHSARLRKGRFSAPGNFYFVTTCVSRRHPIFTDRNNALIVLDTLKWLIAKKRFIVDAAVVMPDHLHFVGELRRPELSDVVHTLKSYSAHRLINAGVQAPVWQSGFHDHALRRDEDYRSSVTYLLLNPVRAGLVERIEDYRFQILPPWWRGVLV